jgi:tripartite-type tricarboxylate transporter receptor subunit TctC
MNKSNRNMLLMHAIAAAFALTALSASAQSGGDYPNKPVHMVVSGGPGGTNDTSARTVSEQLSLMWKQSVLVENRTGGGGAIASRYVARSAPDGYTLFNLGLSTMVSMTMKKETGEGINFKTAFDPISQLLSQPYILEVNANTGSDCRRKRKTGFSELWIIWC